MARAILLLVFFTTACADQRWRGPLAMVADSVFESLPEEGCDTTSVTFGFAEARLPLHACVRSSSGGSHLVLHNADRFVLVVSHTFRVDSASQLRLYDSLYATFYVAYGSPIVCLPSDDQTVLDEVLWSPPARQLSLRRLGFDQVLMESRINYSGCYSPA